MNENTCATIELYKEDPIYMATTQPQSSPTHSSRIPLIVILSVVGGLVIIVTLGWIGTTVIGNFFAHNATSSDNQKTQLESAVLTSVTDVNGVFISTSSSGLGNTELLIRLYLNSSDPAVITQAVDNTFNTAWKTWTPAVSGIEVGVVIGDKPSSTSTVDSNSIDLSQTATTLSIGSQNVHEDIHLDAVDLSKRYGN